MKFTESNLKGVYIVDLTPIADERGYFARMFAKKEYEALGLNASISQGNTSFNKHSFTLRGLHYQRAPHAEVKIVRCIRGSIFDVAVDIRPSSPTFKQWVGVELSDKNNRQLYIPEGFAHGFLTLEENTEVQYLVTADYHPQSEGGIRYDDPTFAIQWPHAPTVQSEKDQNWPLFEEVL
ncbi:MAG: dTDP-4-dehydrorhamnose 3,5-epimerase [Microgenomates group bacterium]